MADFSATHAEALGAESAYPPGKAATRQRGKSCCGWWSITHDRRALDMWSREVGSVGISFAPGTTGIMGGRPRAVPVIRLLTAFVDKASLPSPV